MSTLYLTEQGSVLGRKYRRLIITKDDQVLKEVSGLKLDRMLIFGNVQITTQAMAFLLDQGIETSFLSSHGKFRGKLAPVESKNVFLRIAQYERFLDEAFCVEYARTIVEAKIKNGKTLIRRYSRDHPEMDFEDTISVLNQALEDIPSKQRISTILGVEGYSTAAYFRAYSKMFRKQLQFTTRNRRPPRDPVNALLSFGYTLITNEVFSILCATGFDPYIGYLHGINYGRPSLSLDVVEEFRHPVIDRFTLNLINNNVLTEDDFEDRKDEGVFLKDESRKKYFVQYEKLMANVFKDLNSGEKVTYRSLFRQQAHKLMRTIQRKEPYQPFLMK
ncbi:MAG: CRISPR-associated endonuclease Cas1 [bacterium]|nr:CRISPR-associated endonuclease Cas1 [bacterium]